MNSSLLRPSSSLEITKIKNNVLKNQIKLKNIIRKLKIENNEYLNTATLLENSYKSILNSNFKLENCIKNRKLSINKLKEKLNLYPKKLLQQNNLLIKKNKKNFKYKYYYNLKLKGFLYNSINKKILKENNFKKKILKKIDNLYLNINNRLNILKKKIILKDLIEKITIHNENLRNFSSNLFNKIQKNQYEKNLDLINQFNESELLIQHSKIFLEDLPEKDLNINIKELEEIYNNFPKDFFVSNNLIIKKNLLIKSKNNLIIKPKINSINKKKIEINNYNDYLSEIISEFEEEEEEEELNEFFNNEKIDFFGIIPNEEIINEKIIILKNKKNEEEEDNHQKDFNSLNKEKSPKILTEKYNHSSTNKKNNKDNKIEKYSTNEKNNKDNKIEKYSTNEEKNNKILNKEDKIEEYSTNEKNNKDNKIEKYLTDEEKNNKILNKENNISSNIEENKKSLDESQKEEKNFIIDSNNLISEKVNLKNISSPNQEIENKNNDYDSQSNKEKSKNINQITKSIKNFENSIQIKEFNISKQNTNSKRNYSKICYKKTILKSFFNNEIFQYYNNDYYQSSSSSLWAKHLLKTAISSHLEKTKLQVELTDTNIKLSSLKDEIELIKKKIKNKIENNNNNKIFYDIFKFNLTISQNIDHNHWIPKQHNIQTELSFEYFNNIYEEISNNNNIISNKFSLEQQLKILSYHIPHLKKAYSDLKKKSIDLTTLINDLENRLLIVRPKDGLSKASVSLREKIRFENAIDQRKNLIESLNNQQKNLIQQLEDTKIKLKDIKSVNEMIQKQIVENKRQPQLDIKKSIKILDNNKKIINEKKLILKLMNLEEEFFNKEINLLNIDLNENLIKLKENIENLKIKLNKKKNQFDLSRRTDSIKRQYSLTTTEDFRIMNEKNEQINLNFINLKKKENNLK